MNGAFETYTEAEAHYEVTKWIGAIIFYLLAFGKQPFETFHQEKYKLRNTLVGYVLQLCLLALLLYITLAL